MAFDLIDAEWIPVLTADGPEVVSLRQALHRAPELRGLAGSPATIDVAILRQVLLPVVYDALGPPRTRREWADLRRWGRFDLDGIDRYLARHHDRFDLFHPDHPFAQVAGLATAKGEVKSNRTLILYLAGGNNVPLFSSSSEAEEVVLRADEAARWLLHAHCYDTAAIKAGAVGDGKVKAGKTVGNPTGPAGRFAAVIPTGPTLFDTILLNLPIRPDGPADGDCPAWSKAPKTASWESDEAVGVLDLWTWQSRRIRLVTAPDGSGSDESTGGPRVVGVVLTAGDRLTLVPDFEPHARWRVEKKPKAGQPPLMPRGVQSAKAAWRGLEALLAVPVPGTPPEGELTSKLLSQLADLVAEGHIEETYPLNVTVAGVEYGNMSAVVENVVSDSLPLPVVALLADGDARESVLRFAADTDALVGLLDRLEGDVRRALGGELVPWDKGQRASTHLVHRLDRHVRHLLGDLQTDPSAYVSVEAQWSAAARDEARAVAEMILADAPPVAYRGRVDSRDVTHTLPDAELRFRAGLFKVLGPEPTLEGEDR